MRRRLSAAAVFCLWLAALGATGPCDPWVVPPASHTPPLWPEWVLRPWVWLDEPAQQTALDLVEGYQSRDIPTGATIIDAPWYTGAMNFEWDPALFPDPQGTIDALHARNVKVFLWAVSMINLDSPNYAFAKANDFFIEDFFGQVAVVEWWRGPGSFLDYTNPEAVSYWHSLMDGPLSLGIDGWKTDGTDPYLLFVEILGGGAYGKAGRITTAAYSDLFYRDFFEYTREVRGAETAISARPYDSLLGIVGLNFAPRDVNHAGWVGDQDNNFAGLRNAMTNMLRSADTNSVNFGSDIGGYREPDPPNKEVFLRWAQYGAFSPIMENGGGGEHRPWMYDAETVDIYRRFARIHEQLIPYLFSQGARSYELVRPLFRRAEGAASDEKWQFALGDDLFVSAIYQAGNTRSVRFPSGDDWIDFWDETEYPGGSKAAYTAPLDRCPVFVREGGIVPMRVSTDATSFGSAASAGSLTVLVYPTAGARSFDLYEEKGNGATIAYERTDAALTLSMSAHEEAAIFLVGKTDAPKSVKDAYGAAMPRFASKAAFDAGTRGWFHDAAARRLWVKPGNPAKGVRVEAAF